jgi:predicted DNA-binding transcriptional regulator AlpA
MNKTSPTTEKLLLNAREVAALLGIGESSVWALHAGGKLPLPVKLNRRTLWSAEELRDFVRAGCPNRQKWLAMRGQR